MFNNRNCLQTLDKSRNVNYKNEVKSGNAIAKVT